MLCLHQTTRIGKDEPVGLGGKPNLAYARELAERGYVTIAPDYPNFGEYKVDPYTLDYASASMKAIWNNMRAVDLLVSLPEVDANRIGVIGHSLGGHTAIFTAVFDDRLKAVVSSCGFNDFPHYYGGNLRGWSHSGYMPRLQSKFGLDPARVPFDFPELISALAPPRLLRQRPDPRRPTSPLRASRSASPRPGPSTDCSERPANRGRPPRQRARFPFRGPRGGLSVRRQDPEMNGPAGGILVDRIPSDVSRSASMRVAGGLTARGSNRCHTRWRERRDCIDLAGRFGESPPPSTRSHLTNGLTRHGSTHTRGGR